MTLEADGLRALWEKTVGGPLDAPHLAPGRTYRPAIDAPGGAAATTTADALPRATLSGGATLAPPGGPTATLSGGGTLAGGGTLSGGGTVAPATEGGAGRGAAPLGAGRFELLHELGRGGMGVVFRARQESLGRDVAVKRLLGQVNDEHLRRRFLSEALVTGVLDHPNVVPVHELGLTPEGELFMAMKLVGGTSWHDLLHPRTPEQQERARRHDREAHVQTLLAVCNAVAFAHSRGIVHRDLKPENVMVGDFGEVLVMDWGIALDVSPTPTADARAPHRSTVSAPSGTPSYMPPELAEGRGQDIGPWTDVYLLGATLHEVLTGAPPHHGRTLVEVLLAASRSAPPRYGPDVPQGLARLCTKAMARDPRDRHATVAAFQEELRAYLQHRESLLLSERADEDLRALEAAPSAPGGGDRDARYQRFARAIARYEQALDLWADNAQARLGARRARLAHAREALARGDLGLAAAQAAPLPADDAEARALRAELESAQAERAAAARRARTLRVVAGASVLGALAALGAGYLLVSRERDRAVLAQQAEARERERAEQSEAAAKAAQAEAQARAREARERLRHLLTQRSHTESDPAVGALHLIATLGPDLDPGVEQLQRLRIRALLEARTPPARTLSLGWSDAATGDRTQGAFAATFDARGRAWALLRAGAVVELSLDDPAAETVGAPIQLPPVEQEGMTRTTGDLVAAGPRLLAISEVDVVALDPEARTVVWRRSIPYQGSVVVSPDGGRLLVRAQGGGGPIIDAATGAPVIEFVQAPVASQNLGHVAFAGGRLWGVAATGGAPTLHVRDLTGDASNAGWRHIDWIGALELESTGGLLPSPDGDLLAVGVRLEGKLGLVVIDGATGQCVLRRLHPSADYDVPGELQAAWTSPRRLAMLRRDDGASQLFVIDAETGAVTLPSNNDAPREGRSSAMVASPDGRLVAVPTGPRVDVIEVRTGWPLVAPLEGLTTGPYELPPRPSFSPDGGLLLAVDARFEREGVGPVHLWSLVGREPEDRGRVAQDVLAAEVAAAQDEAWGRDHERDHPVRFEHDPSFSHAPVVLTERATERTIAEVHRVPAFDPDAPEGPPLPPKMDWDEQGGTPTTMATSPDGRWFAVVGAFGADTGTITSHRLRVADLTRLRWLPWERECAGPVPLQFAPDGRLVILDSDALELLDVTSRGAARSELPRELREQPAGEASFARLTRSGSAALLARGQTAVVATIGSAVAFGPVRALSGPATMLNLFGDEQRGYVASEHDVAVFDLARGEPLFANLRVSDTIGGVEASPDGRYLIVHGQTVRVFDVATGQPVGGPMGVQGGLGDAVELAFGRDGLLAIAQNGALQLWELGTAMPVGGVIRRPGQSLVEPRFEDDGRVLVARAQRAGSEGDIRELAWPVAPDPRPLDELQAAVELRAGRRLDASGYPVPLSRDEVAARTARLPAARVTRPPWAARPAVTLEAPEEGARLTVAWTRVRARVSGIAPGAAVTFWARTSSGRTSDAFTVDAEGVAEGWLSLPAGQVAHVGARAVGDQGVEGASASVRVTVDATAAAPPAGLRQIGVERLPDGGEVEVWEKPLPAGPALQLVRVPGGPVRLGGDVRVDERELWAGRTEVTWAQYLAFCAATGRPRPPSWYRPPGGDVDRHPVKGITWRDAAAFAAWAGGALPTSEEWQRLAYGVVGGRRRMDWGWGPGPRSHGRYEQTRDLPDASDGFLDTAPVGSFPEDVSPFGALDVAGNVHEWVHADDPAQGVRGRGGSYLTSRGDHGGTEYLGPDRVYHVSDIGLRVVIRSP